jgi:hypothetical protein
MRFERGETTLELFRREEGLVWFQGRRRLGKAFVTVEAAVQFVKDLSELYNLSLDSRCAKQGRPGARKGKPS